MNKPLSEDAVLREEPVSLMDTQIRQVSHSEGPIISLVAGSMMSCDTEAATLALSCLVRPEPGDRVVVQRFSNGELVITSVIESASDSIRLDCDRSLSVTTPGSITFDVVENIKLTGKAELNFDAMSLGIKTKKLDLRSGIVSAQVQDVSVTGGRIETVFNRVKSNAVDCFQFAKNLFRQTYETECVHSGSFTQKVSGSHLSEATYVALVAKKDVRVDGKRIHVG
tara:strand:- start:6229 stop:6903 length:675 start_codon:yes stop_codon:yes gene_type:complete